MSPTSPTIDGGRFPVSLTDPLGLTQFKALVTTIYDVFQDPEGSGPRPMFLKKLMNATNVIEVVESLVQFKTCDGPVMDTFTHLIAALNNGLECYGKRQAQYLHISLEKDEKHFLVQFTNPVVEVDVSPALDEVSATTNDAISESLKSEVAMTEEVFKRKIDDPDLNITSSDSSNEKGEIFSANDKPRFFR